MSEPQTPSIYEQMKAAGVPTGSWQSDLYVPVNDVTRPLIAAYRFRTNVTTFISQIEKTLWYDIPFAYEPWWEARTRNTESV
jgi:hypothetical protein